MKKLFLVLAIAGVSACNSGTTETSPIDSAASKLDSAAAAKIDSIQTKADSLINKIDSATDAKIDTLRAKADSTKK